MQFIFRSSIFTILLFYGVVSVAQQASPADSSNFISYFDKILIKVNISSQTDQYALKTKTGTSLKLNANNEFKTFISLDYQFIGFSYGFSPAILNANNDDDLKGHSSFTDYKLQFFPGQWLQTVSFGKTKGYYIENTGDYVPNWKQNQDPYLQLPNLKNVQWAMSTSYILNRDFSFKNLIYQTQWQKKSAGSFVPTLYYDYSRYSFDFSGTRTLEKDFNLRFGLGYYHSFIIINKFYISPNLIPSIGIRYAKLSTIENGNSTFQNKTYFTRFLDGGIKLGYNSDRWVAGGGINFSVNWYNEDKYTLVENNKLYGILYLGYRFGTPKFITKTYKTLSD
jgi:hypothetical protein